MGYLTLCVIFFKVGLFTIGGGLASLGLLNEYLVKPGFLNADMFYNMVAVSQSTPGPIGVNMATYIGFESHGVPGAIAATFSLVLPSFFIITLIAYILSGFKDNRFLTAAFNGFRPAAIGIILSVAYMIVINSVLDLDVQLVWGQELLVKTVVCALTIILTMRFKLNPVLCIIIGGIVGGIFL